MEGTNEAFWVMHQLGGDQMFFFCVLALPQLLRSVNIRPTADSEASVLLMRGRSFRWGEDYERIVSILTAWA